MLSGAAGLLPGLTAQLTEYLLAPYLGAEGAKAVAAIQPASAPPRVSSARSSGGDFGAPGRLEGSS